MPLLKINFKQTVMPTPAFKKTIEFGASVLKVLVLSSEEGLF